MRDEVFFKLVGKLILKALVMGRKRLEGVKGSWETGEEGGGFYAIYIFVFFFFKHLLYYFFHYVVPFLFVHSSALVNDRPAPPPLFLNTYSPSLNNVVGAPLHSRPKGGLQNIEIKYLPKYLGQNSDNSRHH